MFKNAWEIRQKQLDESMKSAQRQISQVEQQIETLLERIMAASSQTVISAYEAKITNLERDKLKLSENTVKIVPSKERFEEMLELSMKFLASPWNLWNSGNITLQRTVLKLAFAERISYCRNQGARTPKYTLLFNALRGVSEQGVCFGAAEKTRTSTRVTGQRPQRCASTSSATAAQKVRSGRFTYQ